LGSAWKISLGVLTLLAVIAAVYFSALAAVGLVFGFFLVLANLRLLDYILSKVYGISTRWVKVLVTGLYYCRFLALVVILYICYRLLGLRFIGGTLGGVLVYKVFFVAGNVKGLFKR